jgi:23S rRNA (cytosine1962-C5)-methyltransferase
LNLKPTIELLTPSSFADYELIDCGNFEKLERFGKYITIRPEPQAVWDKKLSEKDWQKRAHVKFVPKSASAGNWQKFSQMPDRWNIGYQVSGLKFKVQGSQQEESPVTRHPSPDTLNFRLSLTSFKHVGIFPEQASNWDFIYNSIMEMKHTLSPEGRDGEGSAPKFLNLFAYTGGASLAARAAGAETYHVDSIKQVVSWARENMELSGLTDIRWVVEDALKFVKREVKRGRKYHGIILDPPAYGHGPTGEKWKLEDNINEMMKEVIQLLDEKHHFLILNTYSLGFSSLIVENLLKDAVNKPERLNIGELYLDASSGVKLPLGVFGRFRNF